MKRFLPFILWVLAIAAVLLSQATTPLLVLAVVAVALYHRKHGPILPIAILLALFGGLAFLIYGWNTLSDGNGRYAIWKMTMKFWAHSDWQNIIFGFGNGTVQNSVPILQRANGVGFNQDEGLVRWWQWMHSDWLQLIFEQGVVGLGAGLLALGMIMKSAKENPVVLAACAGFTAMMLTNFPNHWPVCALLGAILVRAAFVKEKT